MKTTGLIARALLAVGFLTVFLCVVRVKPAEPEPFPVPKAEAPTRLDTLARRPRAGKPPTVPTGPRKAGLYNPSPCQSRLKVCNDGGIRSTLIVGDRQGRLPAYTEGWWGEPTWTLTSPLGVATGRLREATGKESTWFDPLYHGRLTIPAGSKPGRWTLTAGGVTIPFDVVEPPRRKPRQTYGPDVSVNVVQAALNGGNDVLLRPGIYEWSAPLFLPAGAKLTGEPGSTTIVYSGPKPAVWEEWKTCVISGGGEWAVVDGLTFRTPPQCRVVAAGTLPYATFIRCRFDSCAFADPGPGFHVEDSVFTGPGAGAWLVQGGLFVRVRWENTSAGHPLSVWAADHNLITVDCVCDGTDRGPIFQTVWGDVRGNLFLGWQVLNVNWSENGCESFLQEPAADRSPFGFHDNMILHYRLQAGAGGGTLVQWDGRATNNLVMEANADGSGGVALWGSEVKDNEFVYVELRNGGGVLFGPGPGNWFRQSAIVNPAPGKFNQHYLNPSNWKYGFATAVVDGYPADADNGFDGSEFVLPAGVTAAPAAVKLVNTKVNGVLQQSR